MRRVSDKLKVEEHGLTIGGRKIWNLRYADDTTLLAKSKVHLETQAEHLRQASLQYGLKINTSKTHPMVLNCNTETISVDGQEIEPVNKFVFLGSMLERDNNNSTELTKVWQSKHIRLETKKKLMKTLVWSIATYGCESWTLKLVDEKRISTFELCSWRRLLQMSWTEHKT